MVDLADRLRSGLSGRYSVQRELGRGGMACVFLAEERHPRRMVALKVLDPDLGLAAGAERFLQEVDLAANLTHPHILPIFSAGEAEGLLYYTMPYVDGESLRQRLDREKQLPIDDALRIAREVADALSYAHARGVIHRDIKPENILLESDHAVVADFGIARAISAAGGDRLTATGLSVGSPRYMSPEQAAGEREIDGRSDVYSLGCVLYEMLAGEPPFTGSSPGRVLHKHLTTEATPVRRLRPSVSEQLEQVVARGMAKSPADRFRVASEFAAALAGTEHSAESGHHRSRGIRSVMLLSGAALVLAAAAVLLWNARRGGSTLEIGAATQLTADDGLEIDPAISPDGKLVAYASGRATHMRIYLRPVGGGRTIPLSEDSTAFEFQPRWSPDGSRILYLTQEAVFVAAALGGTSRNVARLSHDRAVDSAGRRTATEIKTAAWAPDGSRILVVRVVDHAGASRTNELAIVSLDDGTEQPLVSVPFGLHSCRWSHRGEWIACASGNWESLRPGNAFGNIAPSAIVLVSGTSGEIRQVADPSSLNLSPVWSSDDRHLYFVSNRHGPRDVYAVGISRDGRPRGSIRRLTVGLGALSIALSADGRRIAYAAYNARANVWSLPIPTGGPVNISGASPLTRGNQLIEALRVSSDRQWLVYDSNLHGNADIFRIPVAGGTAERLTIDPADEFAGDLSPDGEEVAYHQWRAGSRDILVRSLSSGQVHRVTDTPSSEIYPVWAPDGHGIAFIGWVSSGQSPWGVFVTRRDASGMWSTPVLRHRGLRVSWSEDGELLAISRGGAVEAIHPDSGPPRALYTPAPGTADPKASRVIWSEDGTEVYFKSHDADGRASLWSVARAGGEPRLLVRFDDLSRPSIRSDFAAGDGRFFFTIEDRQSDVWVAEIARR